MYRKLKIAALCLLAIVSISATSKAQETMTPEKRELIRELYKATKADKLAEQTATTLIAQMETDLPKFISLRLETRSDLTKKQKAEALKIAADSATRITKRFRELLPERINFSEAMEQIFFPLYDKYFTEDELREIVAFYKTPIGQKSLNVLPNLMADAIQLSDKVLTPKVLDLVNEILAEEQNRMINK